MPIATLVTKSGATGPTGPSGASGSPGAAGASGTPGVTGPTGPTGPSGSPGSNGAAGASGASGPSGSPGRSAYQGVFSTSTNYQTGDIVTNNGVQFQALVVVTAGAWNGTQWLPVGLNWPDGTANYSGSVAYNPGDAVVYQGSAYRCITSQAAPGVSSPSVVAAVGPSAHNNSSGAETMTIPSGVLGGDLLIAVVECANQNQDMSSTHLTPTGTGWTLAANIHGSSTPNSMGIWTRSAVGTVGGSSTDASSTFTVGDGNIAGLSNLLFVLRGGVIDTAAGFQTASSSAATISMAGITTTSANEVVIAVAAPDNYGYTLTQNGSPSNAVTDAYMNTSTGIFGFTLVQATAGAVNTGAQATWGNPHGRPIQALSFAVKSPSSVAWNSAIWTPLALGGTAGASGAAGAAGASGSAGPSGATGPTGPAGINWRGTWASGMTSAVNDGVYYNGASYRNIVAQTSSSGPITLSGLSVTAPYLVPGGAVIGHCNAYTGTPSGNPWYAGGWDVYAVNAPTGIVTFTITNVTGGGSPSVNLWGHTGTFLGGGSEGFTSSGGTATIDLRTSGSGDSTLTYVAIAGYGGYTLTMGSSNFSPGTTTTSPDADTTHWTPVSLGGATGPTGPQAVMNFPDGANQYSGTVAYPIGSFTYYQGSTYHATTAQAAPGAAQVIAATGPSSYGSAIATFTHPATMQGGDLQVLLTTAGTEYDEPQSNYYDPTGSGWTLQGHYKYDTGGYMSATVWTRTAAGTVGLTSSDAGGTFNTSQYSGAPMDGILYTFRGATFDSISEGTMTSNAALPVHAYTTTVGSELIIACAVNNVGQSNDAITINSSPAASNAVTSNHYSTASIAAFTVVGPTSAGALSTGSLPTFNTNGGLGFNMSIGIKGLSAIPWNSSNWGLFAGQGATGATGPSGAAGASGPSGAAGAAGPGSLLASLQYGPASNATVTSNTNTLTAIDSTNLSITFTAPTSGNVNVHLTALAAANYAAGGNYGYWALLDHSSGNLRGTPINIGGTSTVFMISAVVRITGLSSGTSYTVDWAAGGSSSGGPQLYYGPALTKTLGSTASNGPATMEVFSA